MFNLFRLSNQNTQGNYCCQSEEIVDHQYQENLLLRSDVCQFLHSTLDDSAFLPAEEMLKAHHSLEQRAEMTHMSINVLIKINRQIERA